MRACECVWFPLERRPQLGKDLQRRFRMCADGEAVAAEDLMRKEREAQAAAVKPKARKTPKRVTDDDGWTTVGAAGAAAAAGSGDGASDDGSGSEDGEGDDDDESGSDSGGGSERGEPPAKAAASTTVDGWTTVAKSGSKGRRRR